MVCRLEPAKPLSTSTAVFIAVRMAVLQRTGYSTLVYQPQSYPNSSSSSSSTIWYERTCALKPPLLQRLPKS